MILEKAFVHYKKNGDYDYTVNSNFYEFNTEKEAKKFVLDNLEKNYEYYFYKNNTDYENNLHYDVIIANDILKK